MVRTAGLPLAAQPAAPKTGEPAYHALRSAAGLTPQDPYPAEDACRFLITRRRA